MKQLIDFAPAFDPVNKTLDFGFLPGFDSKLLYGVINVTRNQILYAPGTSAYGGTWNGNVLTLTFDTASYSTNDMLNIYYESAPGSSSNYLINNEVQERGGMLQTQTDLLKQILVELKLHTFIMAEAYQINENDVESVRDAITDPGNPTGAVDF